MYYVLCTEDHSALSVTDEYFTGVRCFAEALRRNITLTELSLDGNAVGSVGVAALAEGLGMSPSLTALHVGSNQVGDAGGRALALALLTNRSLLSLDLSFNSLQWNGICAIAASLEKNHAPLTNLSLAHTDPGQAGAQALALMLELNTALATLRLERCINSADKQTIYSAVERSNFTLCELAGLPEVKPLLMRNRTIARRKERVRQVGSLSPFCSILILCCFQCLRAVLTLMGLKRHKRTALMRVCV